MCREVKITTGAMLVGMLSPRVVLATMAVVGSGVALYVVAGTALTAYGWMFLVGWAAIATILLLRRHADPVRHMAPQPARVPRRAQAQIVVARRVPELETARPAITYTTETADRLER